jgi:translation initiation factor 4E
MIQTQFLNQLEVAT